MGIADMKNLGPLSTRNRLERHHRYSNAASNPSAGLAQTLYF
jgi:hypothetical protein